MDAFHFAPIANLPRAASPTDRFLDSFFTVGSITQAEHNAKLFVALKLQALHRRPPLKKNKKKNNMNSDFDELAQDSQLLAAFQPIKAQHEAFLNATTIQSVWRMYKTKLYLKQRRRAAIAIQNIWRMHDAKLYLKTLKRTHRAAQQLMKEHQQRERIRIAGKYSFEDSAYINHIQKEDQREAQHEIQSFQLDFPEESNDFPTMDQEEAITFHATRGMTLDQLAHNKSTKRGRSDDIDEQPDAKRARSYEPQSPTLTYCPLANPLARPPVKLLYGPDIEFRKIISALGEPHWPASTNVGDRRYDDGTGFVIVDRLSVAKLSLQNEGLDIQHTDDTAVFTIHNISH